MALINNGYKRGSKVIVEKYEGTNMATGYPKTYDALTSFSGYSALTQAQFAELSLTAFNERMNAFEIYVQGEEAGADFASGIVAGFERRKYDTTACPRGW